jgi:hypothetical protein
MNSEYPAGEPSVEEARRAFRRTLVRVGIIQAVALLLLWLLQARYNMP